MTNKVLVIDYGMGNLRSVANALRAVGAEPLISDHPASLKEVGRVILPGVGAFGDGMRNLTDRGWREALEASVRRGGMPYLGLCLGMQLVAARGTEHGDHEGLGWIPGTVERLPEDNAFRVPHIGWNAVQFRADSRLFRELGESPTFYFVHSYALVPQDPNVVAGRCEHGPPFVAAIEHENIFGTQFHPEKSQKTGLAVLKSFVTLAS